MAARSQSGASDLYGVPDDLPDDTEDSIVGTEWHQEASSVLAVSLAAVAERRGASWGVCEEVALAGLSRQNGTAYTPRPDVFVLANPIHGGLAEIALAAVGAPLLVIEVGSVSTLENDLEGKRIAYERARVREYIVFDPSGEALADGVRAWRRGRDGRFEEWEAASSGAWESSVLEVAFVVDLPFLRVRDRDGWLIPLARRAPLQAFAAESRARQVEDRARQAEGRARQAEEKALQEERARLRSEEELRQVRARLRAIEAAQGRSNVEEDDAF